MKAINGIKRHYILFFIGIDFFMQLLRLKLYHQCILNIALIITYFKQLLSSVIKPQNQSDDFFEPVQNSESHKLVVIHRTIFSYFSMTAKKHYDYYYCMLGCMAQMITKSNTTRRKYKVVFELEQKLCELRDME